MLFKRRIQHSYRCAVKQREKRGIAQKAQKGRHIMDELNVKVGDKVIYERRGMESIVTVTKVTPTGRIRIDFIDGQFDKYGWKIGGDIWFCPRIKRATPEDIKRIEQKNTILEACKLCQTISTKNLSYEKALKIIEILGENKSEQ